MVLPGRYKSSDIQLSISSGPLSCSIVRHLQLPLATTPNSCGGNEAHERSVLAIVPPSPEVPIVLKKIQVHKHSVTTCSNILESNTHAQREREQERGRQRETECTHNYGWALNGVCMYISQSS